MKKNRLQQSMLTVRIARAQAAYFAPWSQPDTIGRDRALCQHRERVFVAGRLASQSTPLLDGAHLNSFRALCSFCEQDVVRLRRIANLKSEASF